LAYLLTSSTASTITSSTRLDELLALKKELGADGIREEQSRPRKLRYQWRGYFVKRRPGPIELSRISDA